MAKTGFSGEWPEQIPTKEELIQKKFEEARVHVRTLVFHLALDIRWQIGRLLEQAMEQTEMSTEQFIKEQFENDPGIGLQDSSFQLGTTTSAGIGHALNIIDGIIKLRPEITHMTIQEVEKQIADIKKRD